MNVGALNSFSPSPLHEACSHGQMDVAIMLLDRGASLTDTSFEGSTPLHLTIM